MEAVEQFGKMRPSTGEAAIRGQVFEQQKVILDSQYLRNGRAGRRDSCEHASFLDHPVAPFGDDIITA